MNKTYLKKSDFEYSFRTVEIPKELTGERLCS